MNIPNLISLFRLLLVPVFALVFFSGREDSMLLSAAVFVISGVSDMLDGYIARKYQQVTDIGKILDPAADKLMQTAVILCLCLKGIVPFWAFIIFLLKELLMFAGGAAALKKYDFVVHSNWYGKLATGIFYAVMIVILVVHDLNEVLKIALLAVAIASTLFASIMYFFRVFLVLVKNRKTETGQQKGM